MKLDYEKYRSRLAPLNSPREDEDEILEYLWHMMGAQVDRAFNMHPVQLSCGKLEDDILQSPNLIVGNKRAALNSTFEQHTH